jgi:hypothetical protein
LQQSTRRWGLDLVALAGQLLRISPLG